MALAVDGDLKEIAAGYCLLNCVIRGRASDGDCAGGRIKQQGGG
jgi:hypothetical protein